MKDFLSHIDLSVVKIYRDAFNKQYGIQILNFDTLDDDRSLFDIFLIKGEISVDLFFMHMLK